MLENYLGKGFTPKTSTVLPGREAHVDLAYHSQQNITVALIEDVRSRTPKLRRNFYFGKFTGDLRFIPDVHRRLIALTNKAYSIKLGDLQQRIDEVAASAES